MRNSADIAKLNYLLELKAYWESQKSNPDSLRGWDNVRNKAIAVKELEAVKKELEAIATPIYLSRKSKG